MQYIMASRDGRRIGDRACSVTGELAQVRRSTGKLDGKLDVLFLLTF